MKPGSLPCTALPKEASLPFHPLQDTHINCKAPDMMAGLSMRSHSMHNIHYVCIIQCVITMMKSSKIR